MSDVLEKTGVLGFDEKPQVLGNVEVVPSVNKSSVSTSVTLSDDYYLSPAGQDQRRFELSQRKAQAFATSTIVPMQFQKNVGNCVIAMELAERLGASPLMVMQNLNIIHGMPSFSAKFIIACVNASHRFFPLRYEWSGTKGQPDYGCRCFTYDIHDVDHKEPLYGELITLEMAKKEGWSNNPKWSSMPTQMLMYRAAAFWQRIYCPEISMGLLSAEEAEDVEIINN